MQISDIDLDKVITLAEEADVAKKSYNAVDQQLVEARNDLRISEKEVENLKTNQTFANRHVSAGRPPPGVDVSKSRSHEGLDFAKQIPAAEKRVEIAKAVLAKLQDKLNRRGEINIEKHHIIRRVKSALLAENIRLDILEKY